jgi:hypothetical protein
MNIINLEVATNIAAHAQLAWHYGLPNDEAGEVIICSGLDPFYPTEHKGGSTTIVDATVVDSTGSRIALDIKCRQVLKTFTKAPGKRQEASNNTYYNLHENLYVSKPPSVMCPVRRPSVDLKSFKGDAKTILTDQIAEYATYANTSIAKANCSELRSIILMYGEHHGYKAIYINEQPFDTPVPTGYDIYTNKKGDPAAYEASDSDGLLYKLMNYSEGSANFNKRFDCTTGYMFVWPSSSRSTLVTRPSDWASAGNYSMEI